MKNLLQRIKEVAKKKVAKKVTKKVAKKKVAKKATKKKVAKKKVAKEVKKAEEVKVEKVAPISVPSAESTYEPENTFDESELNAEETPTEKSTDTDTVLADEYNPDDEQDVNAFGYGWSYDEALDSPEEAEKEEEPFDEDAEYANSGKPVGYDLDKDEEDDDMY